MAILHFYCDLPASVFVGGREINDSPYIATPNECVSACVMPAFSGEAYLAYSFAIRLENDRVISATGGAQVIAWSGGIFDVILHPPKLPFRHSPVTLAQTGERSLATLYDDGEMHLMCEGACFFVRDLPRLASYSLTSSERGEFLVILTGRTQENAYVLVISSEGGGRVVHEHLAERIDVTEGGVTVTERIVDMKRRKRTRTYNSNGDILSSDFERTERKLPDLLLPYALLEAVQAGDKEDALSYLSDELCDWDALVEFFGNFDTVCQPKDGRAPLCVAVYGTESGITVPRTFCFEISDGVITAVHEK